VQLVERNVNYRNQPIRHHLSIYWFARKDVLHKKMNDIFFV